MSWVAHAAKDKDEKCLCNFCQKKKQNRRDHFKDLLTDGKNRPILKKQVMRLWTRFIWLRI
jgi:hypothetical protein